MKKQTPRDKYLLRVYGITELEYNSLLKKQGNCCAICGKNKTQEKRNLAVDHDHKTGRIRGLLCSFCNQRLIGRHRDPVLFEAAARYLHEDSGTQWFVPTKKRKRKRRKR